MEKKIQKLEDLITWKEAKTLAVSIYKLTSSGNWIKDYSLQNQIRRSAISVPSNIAEGYGRGGNKEFIQFLYVSKGSLYELKTQLIIANEIGYIEAEAFEITIATIEKIAKLISGLINYLKQSEYKGNKFAEPEIEYGQTSNYELKTSN